MPTNKSLSRYTSEVPLAARLCRRLVLLRSFRTVGRFALLDGTFVLQHRSRLFTGFDEFYAFSPTNSRDLTDERWTQHFTSEQVELRAR